MNESIKNEKYKSISNIFSPFDIKSWWKFELSGKSWWWKYKKAAIRKETFLYERAGGEKSFRMYVEAYEQEDYALWAV